MKIAVIMSAVISMLVGCSARYDDSSTTPAFTLPNATPTTISKPAVTVTGTGIDSPSYQISVSSIPNTDTVCYVATNFPYSNNIAMSCLTKPYIAEKEQ